jgi:hypothetical protein
MINKQEFSNFQKRKKGREGIGLCRSGNLGRAVLKKWAGPKGGFQVEGKNENEKGKGGPGWARPAWPTWPCSHGRVVIFLRVGKNRERGGGF